MSYVSRHECNQPSSNDTCSLSEVIFGNSSNWQDGECTINCRKSKHAPPHSIITKEWLKNHCTDSQRPGKQRRTWVCSTNWVESICVHDKVSILSKNVVNNTLHVPRVRTASQVETIGSKRVHGRNCVPLNSDNKANQEGYRCEKTSPVSVPKLTSTTRTMLFSV